MQEGIYDEFVEKFKERAKKNVVGDPFKEETFQGPQVSDVQFKKIMEYAFFPPPPSTSQLFLLSIIRYNP